MSQTEKITIEYDGEYPNLCSGQLTVIIGEARWKFPSHCMSPGGSVGFDKDYNGIVEQGEWTISEWPHLFPEELKGDVLKQVNIHVEHGNCGGCL